MELHFFDFSSEQENANRREGDLEDSLQAQQYFAEANEAESWMKEKEPIVANPDYGKDEDSAEVCKTCFISISSKKREQKKLKVNFLNQRRA